MSAGRFTARNLLQQLELWTALLLPGALASFRPASFRMLWRAVGRFEMGENVFRPVKDFAG